MQLDRPVASTFPKFQSHQRVPLGALPRLLLPCAKNEHPDPTPLITKLLELVDMENMTIQVVPVIGFESVRGFGVQIRSEKTLSSRVKLQVLLQADAHVEQHTSL